MINQVQILNKVLTTLKSGDISCMNNDVVVLINTTASYLLRKILHDNNDIMLMGMIIDISNILYENTSMDILPLEDGIYDLLIECYKKYNPNFQVGAIPVEFKSNNENLGTPNKKLISFIPKEFRDNMMYSELLRKPDITGNKKPLIGFRYNDKVSKRMLNTSHVYPELVGTLDKSKFVLVKDAVDRGVETKSNVSILERDFFAKHIKDGIYDANRILNMVIELKYDGVSVEGTVSNMVYSARSRGDTNNDLASDLTPIFYGYPFYNANGIVDSNDTFGMKFEAVMSYQNLIRFNQLTGYNYKNCRTAIIGLTHRLDAAKYRDLVTLVPLATSLHVDRLTEIEFMNKYYTSGECLRYAVLSGTYTQILWQVKKFVEEAEFMRPYMPIMYDGVVLSYIDEDIKAKLGRENSINKYSIAVKFNAMKKYTTFRGFKYTVGQDSRITPMVYFDPVEFYGTIHDNTTLHSYKRFMELGLREDDILEAEYTNDCIVYVTKPMIESNLNNTNPVIPFISCCPSCGSELEESDSGKTILCPNQNCPGKNLRRMVNMISKLNIKDFAEASLSLLDKWSLQDLINCTIDDTKVLGDVDSIKFLDVMKELKSNPIYDYQIVGALGFSNIGAEKWKALFVNYTLEEILSMNYNKLYEVIDSTKGLGKTTATVIINELPYFMNDLLFILNNFNLINSKGMTKKKTIRFTGIRDAELIKQLCDMGYDAGEGSVTKSTDILIIPMPGFTSSKTSKAGENTLIIPINEFKNNMSSYLL